MTAYKLPSVAVMTSALILRSVSKDRRYMTTTVITISNAFPGVVLDLNALISSIATRNVTLISNVAQLLTAAAKVTALMKSCVKVTRLKETIASLRRNALPKLVSIANAEMKPSLYQTI